MAYLRRMVRKKAPRSRSPKTRKMISPLIGVIHLPPLPGAPGASNLHPTEALRRAGSVAIEEARLLSKAGFGALILENFGDSPFYGKSVPPETVASLAVIAAAVREVTSVPIGINVLRNDAKAALAIAAVTGCDFIRVNVLAGVSATDQGLIEGCAAELLRERSRLGAWIAILADADVKHARSLSMKDLATEIEDLALRAGADGVIITGPTTGRSPETETLDAALSMMKARGIPIWIGSGADSASAARLRKAGFGIIVGSSLRKGGKAGATLDANRIKKFIEAAKGRRGSARSQRK